MYRLIIALGHGLLFFSTKPDIVVITTYCQLDPLEKHSGGGFYFFPDSLNPLTLFQNAAN